MTVDGRFAAAGHSIGGWRLQDVGPGEIKALVFQVRISWRSVRYQGITRTVAEKANLAASAPGSAGRGRDTPDVAQALP